MAEYINIKGQNIEVVSSDPANPTTGQIWYNSTSNTLKGFSVTTAGAWASGATMPYAVAEGGGVGPQTAGLQFAGNPGSKNTSLEYDGSTWTSGGNLNSGRGDIAGEGSQTSALAMGGSQAPSGYPVGGDLAESYNGTTWAVEATIPTPRYGAASAGQIETDALLIGGYNGSAMTDTSEYNGTAWTSVGNLTTASYYFPGFGTQTAAVITGGGAAPGYFNPTRTEIWNGSTWTGGTAYPISFFIRGSGAGLQTAGMVFGGQFTPGVNTYTAATNYYDGSTWSSQANLPVAKTGMQYCSGNASQSSALAIGGSISTGATGTVEEWTGAGAPTTVTITAS